MEERNEELSDELVENLTIELEKEQVYEGAAEWLSKLMVLKGKSVHPTQNEQPTKNKKIIIIEFSIKGLDPPSQHP